MSHDGSRDHDGHSYRRLVLDGAAARLEDMTSVLLDALFGLPGFTMDARQADVADLRRATRYIGRTLLEALRADRPLLPEELGALQVIGARRADVPRDVVAAGIAVTCEATLDFLLDVAQRVPGPAPVAVGTFRNLRESLNRLGAEATMATVSGVDGERQGSRSEARERVWLVDRLIHGLFHHDEDALDEATRIGCDLRAPVRLVLVVPVATTTLEDLRSFSTAVAAEMRGVMEGPVRPMPMGPHAVLILDARSDARFALQKERLAAMAASQSVYVMVSEPVPLLLWLRSAYRRAVRDLDLPGRVKLPPGVLDPDDLSHYRLITGAPPEELLDFADRFVRPLTEAKGAERLIETVEALYRTRDGASGAAAVLGTHVNTVYDRVRKVTEITACDLSVPEQAARVFIGLRLRFVLEPDALAD